MSQRIRGKDVNVQFSVDGVPQNGTFIKMTELTMTPKIDVVEEDFIGERQSDLDIIANGWDLSFTLQEQDAVGIDLVETIINREENSLAHPRITMTCFFQYRELGTTNRTAVFYNVFLAPKDHSVSGAKEYTNLQFEGKSKRRKLFAGG